MLGSGPVVGRVERRWAGAKDNSDHLGLSNNDTAVYVLDGEEERRNRLG